LIPYDGFHVAFITAQLAFLVDAGFDARLGAWSIAIIRLCNGVGTFLSGVWSGRVFKRHLLVGIYLGRAVAISLFLLRPMTLPSVLTFSAVMGFLWLATVFPTSDLVAVMFGTRYMALLYGIVFLGHQTGSFSGVWLGVAFGVMAAIMHWPIDERPVPRLIPKSTPS
jgi:hypothetical protein